MLERLRLGLAPNKAFDAERAGSALRASMQRHALVEKTAHGLAQALAVAQDTAAAFAQGGGATPATLKDALTVQNMATTAQIILEACLARTETRSGHYRTDHPERNDAAFGRSFVQRQSGAASTFTPLAYAAE